MSHGRAVRAALVVALGLASPTPAAAEWFIAPFLGVKFAGDTSLVDDQGAGNRKLTYGATAGFLGPGILGVEVDFGYSPRFFDRSSGSVVVRSTVVTVMGNIIATVPRDWTGYSLRPFVSGGGGFMHVGIDYLADVFRVDSNRFALNVGGGAFGGLTARTSVRFDLRYFQSVVSDEDESVGFGPTSLSFWRASAGITIR